MRRKLLASTAAAILTIGTLCCGVGVMAAEKYQTRLSPVALNDGMRANIAGEGTASAALDGNTLSVSGKFSGLATPATDAHLFLGALTGVPGNAILNLTVSPATNGTVTGTFKLNAKQAAALRSGDIYVQIDSEKAPSGNLWGWLLPEHEIVGQDVPQQGHWFMPQSTVKEK